jgi:hypothetical protein
MNNAFNCEIIRSDLNNKINFSFKVSIIVITILLIIEWWSIIKVLNSKEDYERKDTLIRFIIIMLNTIMITFMFFIIYQVFLSGIDF